MSAYNSGRMKPALVVGAIIFAIALIMLLWLGDYGFIAALFLAVLLALLTTIVIYLAFGLGEAPGHGASAQSAPASAMPASANTGASTKPDTSASDAAAKAAADAEAAKAKEAEAARAAEAEKLAAAEREAEAAKAAEAEKAAEAARAAEAEAEAKAKAEAEAQAQAQAQAAEASTETSAAASSAPEGEDYDGDGVVEGVNEGTRPAGLDAPRGGSADDLKMIKGVGPEMERLCNSMGFWHFDQVASWSADEVAWVDANLKGFKGRVSRDKWVEQAQTLASGGETEFSKRVEGGDVY